MIQLILFSTIFIALAILVVPQRLAPLLPWLASLGHSLPYLGLGRITAQLEAGMTPSVFYSINLFESTLDFSFAFSREAGILLLALLPFFILISVGDGQAPEKTDTRNRRRRLVGTLLTHLGLIGLVTSTSVMALVITWPLFLLGNYLLVFWDQRLASKGGAGFRHAVFAAMLLSTLLLTWSLVTLASAAGTFDFAAIIPAAQESILPTTQWWILLGVFLAVAVVLPTFPLHGWLSSSGKLSAVTAALLVGLVSKGALLILITAGLRLLPDAAPSFGFALVIVGLLTMAYGALAAFGTTGSTSTAYHGMIYNGILLILAGFGTEASLLAFAFGLVLAPYLLYFRYLLADWASAIDSDKARVDKPHWAVGLGFGIALVLVAFLPGSPGLPWLVLTLSALRISWITAAGILVFAVCHAGHLIANRATLEESISALISRRHYLAAVLAGLLILVGLFPGALTRWLLPVSKILSFIP
ncbi:MAG: hypothetical protein GX030_09905 [Firmicutes bacterium]|nr:hypothetical protein [Bacillota bacterium]